MMLSLSNVLIEKICNEVDRLEDKKNLRRTCCQLGRILRPHVLSAVSLNVHKHNLKSGLDLLHALVHQKEVYSPHIRTLYIDSLSPSFFPDPEFARKQYLARHTRELFEMARGWVSDPSDDRNPEVVKAHTALKTLLDPALRSLHNLETVHLLAGIGIGRIRNGRSRRLRNHYPVSTASRSSRSHSPHNVSRPTDVWHSPFTQLPDFSNLHVLSISVLPEGNTKALESLQISAPAIIIPLMSHFLSQTTSLSRLHLDTGSSSSSCPPFPLDDIRLTNSTLPSSIIHLSISGWSVDILPDIPVQFPNLSSLSVRIGRQSEHGLRSLFDSLTSNDIRLRSLIFDKVTDAMLDYISSYSGLETLLFTGPNWYSDRPGYDETADRFYGEILPLHQDSLVNLEILPAFEGNWRFGLEAIRKCTKLRCLGVRMRSVRMYVGSELDLRLLEQAVNGEPTPNLVYMLLDMINTNLPGLQTLHIDSAHFSDSSPGSGAGYCRGVRNEICKSLEAVCDSSIDENAHRREILRWVKIYVAGEKFEMTSTPDDAIKDQGRGLMNIIESSLKAVTARMSLRSTGRI
ncbi:hypothetical protein K435DRAFT_850949 [Dendrothele bispora CBS 962.96]|uniref:F-box domain-containing protein n=1 Tax=Dendrothele bispora (strain CBS 962.96) TaxID=1314807 RepID=A0A4S8MP16_DENBC|nr:hypothetical protein K435DRAFT_850949 [Dendrothele bispora CBS 962.96]